MASTVALYVRSSKDRHDVSCESQVVELTAAVHAREETIFRVYEDKALSSTQDALPALQALRDDASLTPPPFSKIYCLDTSRIGRSAYHAQSLKYYLRKKRGIELVFLHLPRGGTYMDKAIEGMMEVWDELHSDASREKSIMGQKQNIRRGYRAGGSAPYGYRLKPIVVAVHRDGHEITKSVNEVDPVTGPIVTEYLERRALGESRQSVLREFERRGIPTPSGGTRWNPSSGRALEENLDAYLGHLVYNRHHELLKEGGYAGGRKFRAREEWVVHPDAHPPLTTPDIAASIRMRWTERPRTKGYSDRDSYHLLTGVLVCGSCCGRYEGDRGYYRCATAGCHNGKIRRETIERIVAAAIEDDFLTPDRLRDILRRDRARKIRWQAKTKSRLPAIDRELVRVERQLALLWERHTDGTLVLEQYRELNGPLWAKKEALRAQIEGSRQPIGLEPSQLEALVLKTVRNVKAWLASGDPVKCRDVIRRFFRRVEIGPREGAGRSWKRELRLISDIDGLTGALVASPGGCERRPSEDWGLRTRTVRLSSGRVA